MRKLLKYTATVMLIVVFLISTNLEVFAFSINTPIDAGNHFVDDYMDAQGDTDCNADTPLFIELEKSKYSIFEEISLIFKLDDPYTLGNYDYITNGFEIIDETYLSDRTGVAVNLRYDPTVMNPSVTIYVSTLSGEFFRAVCMEYKQITYYF